jgi:glycosyltransferase 2 family protein
MFKKILQITFFFGLGATMMGLVFRSQNRAYQADCQQRGIPEADCSLWDKLLHDFSTVHPVWIAAVVLAFTISNLFRARRQQLLLAPLGYQAGLLNSLYTILLGYFANLGFPRIGEVVRAGALAKTEKIPLEKVMGTLVIDRLMDVVCLGFVVGLAFLLEGSTLLQFISQNKGTNATAAVPIWQQAWFLVLAAVGLVGVILLILFRKKIQNLPIFQKITGVLAGFRDGLLSIARLQRPMEFVLCSIGIWLMFYLQCLFNIWAFPPTAHLSASAALMIFVFGTLGFVIPSPGGMGTFHALCIAGMALYGINGSDAFSYANIAFFTVQIFYNLVAGIFSLVMLRGRGSD